MMFSKNAGHGRFEVLKPGAKYKRVLLSVCASNDDEQFDSEFDRTLQFFFTMKFLHVPVSFLCSLLFSIWVMISASGFEI
jgi:hypothetical protein